MGTPRRTPLLAMALLGAAAMLLCGACKQSRRPGQAAPAPPARVPTPPRSSSLLPMIDSHVHIAPLPEVMNLALRIFKEAGVVKFAVKSAGVPGELRYNLTLELADALGEKMAYFTNIDWEDIDDPGWGKREADRLEKAMREGASGIKIFKALGLGVRLKDGKLLRIDDSRLEPIWERAAKTRAIVAWHVADPVAFFKPIDKNNERYDELSMAPDWSFHGKDFPSYQELMDQRDAVVKAHPETIFLGIHLGSYPEDLDAAARLMDRCPNIYLDVAARVPEIGRHPADKARAFFIKYQDRLLFGTDFIITPRGMQLGSVSETPPGYRDALRFFSDHRRYFETADRQFNHPTPIQGRWKIDGINLPPEVLRKFYVDNAERLIFAPRRAWLRRHSKKL